MQPAYPTVQTRYNNLSEKLKAAIKDFEARKGITDTEPLLFEMIGNGDTALVAHKGTFDDEMAETFRFNPLSPQGTINGETIIDPGTDEAIQLLYFTGMYSPNVPKKVIMFMPVEKATDGSRGQTVLRVPPFTKKSNPDLYRYLILSNYMEDNANPARQVPMNGCLYRLIRPVEVIEKGWEQRMALQATLNEIDLAARSTLMLLAPRNHIAHSLTMTDEQLKENFAKFAEKGVNYALLADQFAADETQFNATIERAIDKSIVAVDKDRAMWIFTSSREVICNASPTESTTKQLVDFLLTQNGQTGYKQILASLGDEQVAPAARKGGRPKSIPA